MVGLVEAVNTPSRSETEEEAWPNRQIQTYCTVSFYVNTDENLDLCS